MDDSFPYDNLLVQWYHIFLLLSMGYLQKNCRISAGIVFVIRFGFNPVDFHEIKSKPLTNPPLYGKIISANAGMAELVDARDLKSREA